MSRHARRVNVCRNLILGAVCAMMAVSAVWVEAATKSEKRKAAEELVKEALHREIYGETNEREELLDKAAKESPNYAPAMWHRGFVKHNNKWLKANEFSQLSNEDARVNQYRRVREKYPDTVAGQLSLANWCQKRGLEDQERAHLTQVVRLDTDHAEARMRLGFRQVDGVWMQPGDVKKTIEQLQQERQALAQWRPKMEPILKGLRSKSELKRESAKKRLNEIDDPAALLAMETVLAPDSEQVAMLVVAAADKFTQNEAALTLARLGVYAPWKRVREAAASKLKNRPRDAFVPAMLSAMYTPVQTSMQLYRGPGGRMMYRHTFLREGRDENQLMVLETAYRRIAQPGGDRNEAISRALSDVQRTAQEVERLAAEQNRRTTELNNRVSWVLSSATDQLIPPTPESWWDWWSQYNEVFVEGQKQTRTVQQTRQVNIVDQTRQADGNQTGTQGGVTGRQQYPMDCLAAGTPVWTSTGLMAIEQIQLGDLVLSQDVETGELAYKPVLRTTIRPESTLVKIVADTNTIETSGGHPFWVSGEGWIKARELKAGMELHSVTGTLRISTVKESRKEQTYNLIVADFNTYFVGEGQVLSHDNTVRETTNAIVPGLNAE